MTQDENLLPGTVPEILALVLQSIQWRQQNRLSEALACIEQAIALSPAGLVWQVDRALILAELQRFEEALDAFDLFLRYAPDSPELMSMREKLLADAFLYLDGKLQASPLDIGTRYQRANIFWKTFDFQRAADDYSAILQHDPDHVGALSGQGLALLGLDRLEAALAVYGEATQRYPQFAGIWFNLGNVLQQLGHLDEAVAAYRQAIELRPDFAEAYMEIGHCRLFVGKYAQAWPLLEWRWRTSFMNQAYLPGDRPVWLGSHVRQGEGGPVLAPVALPAGKVLLVWAEQGLGDTLQFARFVLQLAGLGGQVIFRVQASLRGLFQSLPGSLHLVGDDEPLPPHDYQCPLMSLPIALGIGDIPRQPAYLQADPQAVEDWRSRLGPRKKLRVGLAWAGRQYGVVNWSRDIRLALLVPLAGMDLELISLQKKIPTLDREALDEIPEMRCFYDSLESFSDTAALIANLDLVISVDTAVAHLAGALGKPCWLLLRYSSEWRWLKEGNNSSWYPSLRIFRQPDSGNWAAVVAQVIEALAGRRSADSVGSGGAGEML
jgi:Flp pilus assembly protein TadD